MNIRIEPLESRIAPAGLVMAVYDPATFELTLTGDGVDNQVDVFQTGPNTYRVEGSGTDINTAGITFLDIGKLAKLTINGGADDDDFTLTNLRTLTALSFSGGDGRDELLADNLVVKGAVELHANVEDDGARFTGEITQIGGNVTADSGVGATDGMDVFFDADQTVIGGGIFFTGGGGGDALRVTGDGPMTIAKGVQITSGAGPMLVRLQSDGLLKIGKLATGESVLFNGGSAEDTLNFDSGSVSLSGGIRFAGGGDNDRVSFFKPGGTAKIGKLPTGQSILFDGGADIDEISVGTGSVTFAGGIDFTGGDGINSIEFFGVHSAIKVGKLAGGESIRFAGGVDIDFIDSNVASLTLAGGIDFTAGDGSNSVDLRDTPGTVTIGKLATGQSIRYAGGVNDDRIASEVASLTLAGGIELTGGAGANTIDLAGEAAKATIGKLPSGHSIKFTGLGGDDELLSDLGSLTLKGGIEITGGDGSNQIDLRSNRVVKIGKLAGGQSILFSGGADDDVIEATSRRLTLAGGIEINGTGGNDDLFFTSIGVLNVGKFGTGQSVKFTGTTDADIEVEIGGTSTLAGSLEVIAGTGGTEIELFGTVTVGKSGAGVSVLVTGGDGGDDVLLNDRIALAGSLKLDGGNDNDELGMTGLKSLTVKGPMEFIGGAGADTFTLEARALLLASTLTFTGGNDADSFTIQADGTIAGNVTANLGSAAAGTQTVIFQSMTGLPSGLLLKGSLLIDADATNTTADSLTITNVSVAKLIDLKLGGGVSTVNIDNLNAGDEFQLDSGNGADVVNIERGNFFGGSVIKKLATIQLGLGDDQLRIGGPLPTPNPAGTPDSTRVNFLGGLTADGGLAGTDSRNDIVGENDGVLPAGLTEFEVTNLV